ncbi:MAG: alginate export family protein [Planctomycetaceae bacterium]
MFFQTTRERLPDYHLWRFTPFATMTYNDTFTGYIQAIDASAFGYDPPLTPVGIDINRSDLLQYYAEINLGEVGDGNLKYRYGRQFLKYGSQHLLSPLGWSNTFRNFEGHKLLWTSGDWAVDAFSMGSVNAAAGGSGFSPTAFDNVDTDRRVHGAYATYSGVANNTMDLYWLWSDENNRAVNRQDGERHTFGARFAGKKAVKQRSNVVGAWDWDVEGAFQTGKDSFTAVAPGGLNQDVLAGFFSAVGGYTFSDTPWTPSIGGIFYWGSGDDNPADGQNNTIYTLYPLGHAYWGLIDNFSGQNLVDYGMKATVKPHEKLTLLAALHWFDRATANDAVYNIVGAPFAAGTAGTDVGNEVDLVATVKASETLSVQAGYFWFWYGTAIGNSAQARPDASQFYIQTSLTF